MANKSGVPGSIRRQVMLRDHLTCAGCGVRGFEQRGRTHVAYPTPESGISLSIDHIVPRSRGGSSTDLRNLRVLCTRCNSRKGTRVVVAGEGIG